MIEDQYPTKHHCLVLIAVFNGMRWLPEQLSSILGQVNIDLTLVVSVDQSSDGSEEYLNKCATSDPRILILEHGQYFGGAAANFYRLIDDVQFDQFDYVALSDQDDIWEPSKLSQAILNLEHSQAQGYSSNVLAFWPNGKKRLIEKAQAQVQWDYLFEAAGPGCTYVITKKLAKDFQRCLRDHKKIIKCIRLHDWFLYAFARANGYKWIIDPTPHLYYRQHANNHVGTNVGLAAFLIRAKNVLSGWAMKQTCLIARCIGKEHEPIIKEIINGSHFIYLRLMFKAHHCRRKKTDQLIFMLMCLAMTFIGRPTCNESKSI